MADAVSLPRRAHMRLSARRQVVVFAVLSWLIGAADPTNAVEIHWQEGGTGPEEESGGQAMSIGPIVGSASFIFPSSETASVSARFNAANPTGVVTGTAYL